LGFVVLWDLGLKACQVLGLWGLGLRAWVGTSVCTACILRDALRFLLNYYLKKKKSNFLSIIFMYCFRYKQSLPNIGSKKKKKEGCILLGAEESSNKGLTRCLDDIIFADSLE
jgi:hypothetical protein